jgi:hypothetical protein
MVIQFEENAAIQLPNDAARVFSDKPNNAPHQVSSVVFWNQKRAVSGVWYGEFR